MKRPNTQAVLAEVQRYPSGVMCSQISRSMQTSYTTAHNRLSELHKNGFVEVVHDAAISIWRPTNQADNR